MQKTNDEYIFMWASDPILPKFWGFALAQKERRDIPLVGRSIAYYFDGRQLTAYVKKSEIDEAIQKTGQIFLNPTFYKEYATKCQSELAQWWRWIRKVEKSSFIERSQDEILPLYKKFVRHQRDALGFFCSTRDELSLAALAQLQKLVKHNFPEKVTEVLQTLLLSPEIDEVQKQQVDFSSLSKNNPSDEDLLAYASCYPWFFHGQYEDYNITSFLRTQLTNSKENISLKDIRSKKTVLREKQQALFKSFGTDAKKAEYLATLLQEQTVRRLDIKAYWVGAYYLSRNMWHRISKITGIPTKECIQYVFPIEMEMLLQGKFSRDILKIIDRRKRSFVFLSMDRKPIEILDGDAADTWYKNHITPIPNSRSVIKGQAASPGVAKGIVKKVLPSDLSQLEKDNLAFAGGEILLTSMTQPNMVMIARKAGAIIADEGGITSHAAIIAREFRIPCVVGCKTALLQLSEGDEVEVNGSEGTVNVIKKR